jgi:iron complex outermembrane recepter protein
MKFVATLSLLMSLALILLSPAAHSPAFSTNTVLSDIKGKVIDADSQEPLEDIEVRLEDTDKSAVTDSEGEFVIEDLPAGTHTVIVEEEGYEEWVLTVDVLEAGSVEFEVPLEAEGEEED